MIREEVKQLKINSSGMGSPKMTPLFPAFQAAIKEVRADMGGQPVNHDSWYYEGTRFGSDQIAFGRISVAVNYSDFDFGAFSQDEMRYLARKALLECASADYYYHFEKDWD